MWIHHIGEIAIGSFVLLITLHFALHFILKAKKRKKQGSAPQNQDKQ